MTDPLPIPSQAEAMMRRVSPEGRARAMKEQQRRQKARNRLVLRCVLAGIAIALALWAVNALVTPVGSAGLIAAIIAFVAACVAIGMTARERPATIATLGAAALHQLPERTGAWLESQRPALPAPAARLVDGIGVRLEAMTPQLARLEPNGPAADAVRKLLSTELPALLAGYREIPPTLRDQPRGDGQSPTAHLLHGLGVIDGEVGRMTEQLARGAFDELATQNRYLELKYDGGALEG
ncbi:hypothetical protein GCM10009087_02610 [Sphingomonas oligophenolica]|uniref:Uncharacterized protein n=1 Tax=Sphingomonas oligophenolica TaxID=301154 RepID=A0ABU9Y0U5_9SPHN